MAAPVAPAAAVMERSGEESPAACVGTCLRDCLGPSLLCVGCCLICPTHKTVCLACGTECGKGSALHAFCCEATGAVDAKYRLGHRLGSWLLRHPAWFPWLAPAIDAHTVVVFSGTYGRRMERLYGPNFVAGLKVSVSEPALVERALLGPQRRGPFLGMTDLAPAATPDLFPLVLDSGDDPHSAHARVRGLLLAHCLDARGERRAAPADATTRALLRAARETPSISLQHDFVRVDASDFCV
jgi:hypothetical protein